MIRILMLLLLAGCAQTQGKSNFCDTMMGKIRLLQREIDTMSMESQRQIDHLNSEFKEQCPNE